VVTITDGSGSAGGSRLAFTERVLCDTGSTLSPLAARFTDRDVYRAILDGDVDGLATFTSELAEALAAVDYLVADSWEFYNPVHDLCRVIANLAVEGARRAKARAIATFEFAVVGDPAAGGRGDVVLTLDDAALRRKLEAARQYGELRGEVDAALRASGAEAYRTERFRVVDTAADDPGPDDRPYYDRRGEEQVAAGHYRTVLRYREHFVPFVTALRETVTAPAASGNRSRE
jgi:hypothetical protein